MAITQIDDIDKLFSELKKEPKIKAPKPKSEYIELELSECAVSGPFGQYKVVQTISTSQLEYNEQLRTYFVNCAPFQPFVNDVIRAKRSASFPQLKLGLISATTDKIAIMHVSGVEVTKQLMDMTNLVSIDFVLDKENNVDAINSTGIRMKMNVLVDEFQMSDPFEFEKKHRDTIKYTHVPYADFGGAITAANGDFRGTTKIDVAKQCEDAVARAVAQRIKEIEDQKKAAAEDVINYNAVVSALTAISKTDSSLGTLDANDVISKFLSVIKKSD